MLRRDRVERTWPRPRRAALLAAFPPAIAADTPLKIGCSLPLTGAGFTAVGK